MVNNRSRALMMDEPTNHLDMKSIGSFDSALLKFKGVLLFVSHDREFVTSLATCIIEVSPKGISDYHGTYEEYLRDQAATV